MSAVKKACSATASRALICCFRATVWRAIERLVEDERIDGYAVLDVATHLRFDQWGELYATLDNVFDARYAVSRRPVGLRPGMPRVFVLGYKNFW